MAKSKESTEYDLLRLFVWEMDSQGVTRNMIHLDVDESAVRLINERFNVSTTLEQAQRFADKCLANEWLEHVFMGAGQYGSLALTATGHGVVRSLQAKSAARAKRSAMKKASDYVEDHKGLFVVIAAVIALAGVLIKLGS